MGYGIYSLSFNEDEPISQRTFKIKINIIMKVAILIYGESLDKFNKKD